MKNLFKPTLLAAMVFSLPAISHAQNPILASLKDQGVQAVKLDNAAMGEIKGAALLTGAALPSVTQGLKTYEVTWKKFGSQTDYRSYNIIGSSYDPHGIYTYNYEGNTYRVAGDRWLADKVSNANSWALANSTQIDLHVQVLDPNNNYQPSVYGFRDSSWNRPISTFSW